MMNLSRIASWCIVAALLVLSVVLGPNHVFALQPGPPVAEEGVEVLTRGPVHEAFAGTVTFNPEPGIVVPRAPPEAIEEVAPEQRLTGANVDWIPGYWAWDDERTDFLWVSGIWRKLPPGRQWVPGYWGQSGQEFQWTSGYWAGASASEVEYLPEPPASVEEGPNLAATSSDQSWIPGSWQWRQNRYAWRPGFWSAAQRDWVWVPSYYSWAPRGYVFVDGYWDYSVARRGVLFAPVYFSSGIRSRRGYSYSPSTAISAAAFVSHLFLRPSYGHYYFGDYYDSNYSGRGFSPWFSSQSSRRGYDPFYAHERWNHRNDREWDRRLEADFGRRRDREDARPPRTLAAQRALEANRADSRDESLSIAGSLDQLARSKNNRLRFQPVGKEERQRLAQQRQEIQDFRQERRKLEAKAVDASAANPSPQTSDPRRTKLRRSPFVARSADQLKKDQTSTNRREVLKPEVQVEPRRSPTAESNPPKVDRSSANRRKLPPNVNRSSSEPPRHTTNRLPLDTARPQRNVAPRANSAADSPGPALQPRVDQPKPKPQAAPQPRVERSVRQPQPRRKLVQPAPADRIDRAAQRTQPQSRPEPQVKRAQSQPKMDRPASTPRVDRPAAPQQRVKQSRRQAQAQQDKRQSQTKDKK